jgi:DNA-binding response OmpR family regulator
MFEDTGIVNRPWTVRSILVVDDDPLVVKAMRNLLKIEGFNTLGCFTGSEALKIADDNIAAAVLDIHLPDMNGLTLSRQLREALPPEVPIIILSGDSSMDTIRALPDAGATYFFSKPVNTGMLIGKLKEWTS